MIDVNDLGFVLQKAMIRLKNTQQLANMALEQRSDINRSRQILRQIANESGDTLSEIVNYLADKELGVQPLSDTGNGRPE